MHWCCRRLAARILHKFSLMMAYSLAKCLHVLWVDSIQINLTSHVLRNGIWTVFRTRVIQIGHAWWVSWALTQDSSALWKAIYIYIWSYPFCHICFRGPTLGLWFHELSLLKMIHVIGYRWCAGDSINSCGLKL